MRDDRVSDTGEMDLQQIILDELHAIRNDLVKINERIENLEKRFEQVVADLHTVHTLQKSSTERLSVIEQMCVSLPLRSTPVPRPSDGR